MPTATNYNAIYQLIRKAYEQEEENNKEAPSTCSKKEKKGSCKSSPKRFISRKLINRVRQKVCKSFQRQRFYQKINSCISCKG